MDQIKLGGIFGVTIHSPLIRSEIREVLKRQLEFKKELQVNDGLTEDQAFLEVVDIFDTFFAQISEEEKSNFERIHAEEASAAPKEWYSYPEGSEFNNAGISWLGNRSEERRVGKECLRLCRSRWSPYH